jgi:hypothetical protein
VETKLKENVPNRAEEDWKVGQPYSIPEDALENGGSHCVQSARQLAATRIEALTFDMLTIRRARIVCVYLLRRSTLI